MSTSKDSNLSRLLGQKNIARVTVNGVHCFALVDSGAEVSTIEKRFVPEADLQRLDFDLTVHTAGDNVLNYLGVAEIEVDLRPDLPCDSRQSEMVLALVVPDSSLESTVPMILGTNVISQQ